MKRYFIFLAYNGERYSGWQIQPNAPSVQEIIEKGLSVLLRSPIAIVGAGRTDAGVHARNMAAHFECDISNLDIEELIFKLDRFLPLDIAIHKIVEVIPTAHARFDALSRTYKYYVTNAKDPFMHQLKHKEYKVLNMNAMNECAQVLFEYEDFTSFSKLHTDVKTNICKIMYAQWEQIGTDYVFTIKADRFLRNMVRAIVGTLIDAGRGKIAVQDMRSIIEAKDRGRAGSSAPAQALFLEDVEYSDSLFCDQIVEN